MAINIKNQIVNQETEKQINDEVIKQIFNYIIFSIIIKNSTPCKMKSEYF
jgi:hypothetical protein